MNGRDRDEGPSLALTSYGQTLLSTFLSNKELDL